MRALIYVFAALAGLIGGITAAVEIFSRYRDEPFKTLRESTFSWIYLLLNGGLGLAAYGILLLTSNEQEPKPKLETLDFLRLSLTAGLGAAVVIRARVFTARIGSKDVAIGPGYVVDQLLTILDRQIDRARAIKRLDLVRNCMSDIDLNKVAPYVVSMVPGAMQNITAQEEIKLNDDIQKLKTPADIPGQYKSFALGFKLLDLMGEELLSQLLPSDEGGLRKQFLFDAKSVPTSQGELDGAADRAELMESLAKKYSFEDAQAKLLSLFTSGKIPLETAQWQTLLKGIEKIGAGAAKNDFKVQQFGFAVMKALGETFVATNFELSRKTAADA